MLLYAVHLWFFMYGLLFLRIPFCRGTPDDPAVAPVEAGHWEGGREEEEGEEGGRRRGGGGIKGKCWSIYEAGDKDEKHKMLQRSRLQPVCIFSA